MQSPSSADKDAIATAMIGGGDELAGSYSKESSMNGLQTRASQGSLDLRGTVPTSERFEGKSRSAEKVMDKSKRFRKIDGVPGVGTDDASQSITKEFAFP